MRKKTFIWILAISIGLIVGSIVLWAIFGYQNDQYPYFMGHMVGGWMMPMGMIGMGLIWFVILVVLFDIFQSKKNDQQRAIDVLKERLAKGDISIDDYETMKKKIKEDQ